MDLRKMDQFDLNELFGQLISIRNTLKALKLNDDRVGLVEEIIDDLWRDVMHEQVGRLS